MDIQQDIASMLTDLARIRKTSPLVHNITNFVVMNNTANALLAIGASPIMAHAIQEVDQMVAIANSLVLNIGTLSPIWVDAMLQAGSAAQQKKIPIVFDPVGAGATTYRTTVCSQIINHCKPHIIRGNASEIMTLNNTQVATKGVDSTITSNQALEAAKSLAQHTQSIVVISGQTDFITDGKQVNTVTYGSQLMTRVTGMGCTATALVAAFAAVNNNMLQAATHAMQLIGIAGQIAAQNAQGCGTLQVHFLDELYNFNSNTLKRIQ